MIGITRRIERVSHSREVDSMIFKEIIITIITIIITIAIKIDQ